MAKSRDRLSRDRVKAAKIRVAAGEAFAAAVKFQAAGKLKAAHDAMQTAVLATKESLKLQYPWSEREQLQLDKILRGGVRSDGERPLDEMLCDPSPDEARDRVQQFLGWQEAVIGMLESHSDSGRDGAAKGDCAKFNRNVEKALAEIQLPTKRGERSAVAKKHLEDNHLELWQGNRRAGLQGVAPRSETAWFRERMRQSENPERLASKTPQPAKNRR